MFEPLKRVLGGLRRSFTGQAERAYDERDDDGSSMRESAYAAGEGHAFGVASDAVKEAQDRESDSRR